MQFLRILSKKFDFWSTIFLIAGAILAILLLVVAKLLTANVLCIWTTVVATFLVLFLTCSLGYILIEFIIFISELLFITKE